MSRYTHNAMMWLLAVVLLAACDIHEYPSPVIQDIPEEKVEMTLKLNFDFELPPYKELIYEHGAMTDVTRGPSDIYDLRYVCNIYRSTDGVNFSRLPYYTFTTTRKNADKLNYEMPIEVPVGVYRILMWCDYVNEGSSADRYYSTSDFTAITLQGRHIGSDDSRDAFRGEKTVVVAQEETEVVVDMYRPMAKYKFVARDFAKFITRAEEEFGLCLMPADEGEDGGTRVSMDDYKVNFRYTGFMPHIFNMFTDKPADAKMGVTFEGAIKQVSDTEAELGFDYVFVNGQEAIVQVAVDVYAPDGQLISSSGTINVPLVRSQLTTVIGDFLSSRTEGGIGISPDFDGEYNIVIP